VGEGTVNLGATGGSGGGGGAVTAVIGGQIRTFGSDAAGVVLQSIGGGGGVAGSAGAEASSDNTIDILTRTREFLTSVVNQEVPITFSKAVTLGGSNSVSGSGGQVNYTQTGAITTQGDWSHGVVAQSIGGGGGMAGAANSNSSQLGMSTSLRLGATSGGNGNGGNVQIVINDGSRISTGFVDGGRLSGYAAFGILAQSIGGGGGIAADGSVASSVDMTLGYQGSGPAVQVGVGGSVVIGGTVDIVTRGDVAAGLVMQSIGGGGGVAGSGNSYSSGATVSGRPNLMVGGRDGATGYGGYVNIDNAVIRIQTGGAHAYGILAQSIGGGGGFAFVPQQFNGGAHLLGGNRPDVGFSGGGFVTLNMTAPGFITTAGRGAHGIVAQSIGGGGGIAGLPGGVPTLSTTGFSVYRPNYPRVRAPLSRSTPTWRSPRQGISPTASWRRASAAAAVSSRRWGRSMRARPASKAQAAAKAWTSCRASPSRRAASTPSPSSRNPRGRAARAS
jgi:hypothetical protein